MIFISELCNSFSLRVYQLPLGGTGGFISFPSAEPGLSASPRRNRLQFLSHTVKRSYQFPLDCNPKISLPGYGFISFPSAEPVQIATRNRFYMLRGKQIECKPARRFMNAVNKNRFLGSEMNFAPKNNHSGMLPTTVINGVPFSSAGAFSQVHEQRFEEQMLQMSGLLSLASSKQTAQQESQEVQQRACVDAVNSSAGAAGVDHSAAGGASAGVASLEQGGLTNSTGANSTVVVLATEEPHLNKPGSTSTTSVISTAATSTSTTSVISTAATSSPRMTGVNPPGHPPLEDARSRMGSTGNVSCVSVASAGTAASGTSGSGYFVPSGGPRGPYQQLVIPKFSEKNTYFPPHGGAVVADFPASSRLGGAKGVSRWDHDIPGRAVPGGQAAYGPAQHNYGSQHGGSVVLGHHHGGGPQNTGAVGGTSNKGKGEKPGSAVPGFKGGFKAGFQMAAQMAAHANPIMAQASMLNNMSKEQLVGMCQQMVRYVCPKMGSGVWEGSFSKNGLVCEPQLLCGPVRTAGSFSILRRSLYF